MHFLSLGQFSMDFCTSRQSLRLLHAYGTKNQKCINTENCVNNVFKYGLLDDAKFRGTVLPKINFLNFCKKSITATKLRLQTLAKQTLHEWGYFE